MQIRQNAKETKCKPDKMQMRHNANVTKYKCDKKYKSDKMQKSYI